jgi:hypothetical protein
VSTYTLGGVPVNRSGRTHFGVVRVNRLVVAAVLLVGLALLLFPARGFMPAASSDQPRARHSGAAVQVAQGVTLLGRDFSGRGEQEARLMLAEMAEAVQSQPVGPLETRDATGVSYVIPGLNGLTLDLETTWFRLQVAAQGTRVEPAKQVQPPPKRLDDFPHSVIRQANPEKPAIVMLINVDWGTPDLIPMLATLKKHGIRTTFFVSGTWAEKTADLLKLMVADGHEIASHGHNLSSGPAELQRSGRLKADIAKSVETIEAITQTKVKYWAPHMSEISPEIVATATELNLRTVLYTVDTIDWAHSSTPERILSRMLKAKGGDLILLHPKPNTAQVLAEAILELRKRGLQPVTLTEAISPDPTAPGLESEDHVR